MIGLYRALLFLLPSEFRSRYGNEMVQVFADSVADAGGPFQRVLLLGRSLVDLGLSAIRERAGLGGARSLAGLVLASLAWWVSIYVDMHATEVISTVFVLLSAGFLFGAMFPDGVPVWAVLLGLSIPVAHLVAPNAGLEPSGRWAAVPMLFAILPAGFGAYLGLAARSLASLPAQGRSPSELRSNYAVLNLACLGAGCLIGLADFTLITPVFALVSVVLCGFVLGCFCPRPWWPAAVLGFGLPLAVAGAMAMHGRPLRHHFVFVDARAVPICLAAALVGWVMHKALVRFANSIASA